MTRKSRTLEATISKHWRTLVRGGVWIDAYNKRVDPDCAGTILTRLDASNHYYLTDKNKQ